VLSYYLLFKAEDGEFKEKFYLYFFIVAIYEAMMQLLMVWDSS